MTDLPTALWAVAAGVEAVKPAATTILPVVAASGGALWVGNRFFRLKDKINNGETDRNTAAHYEAKFEAEKGRPYKKRF